MSRKFYETKEHLEKENKFKKSLEMYWGRKLTKLHYKYRLDFAIINNGIITGWCETKNRYFKSKGKNFPPKYIELALDKWMHAMDYSYYTKKTFVFAIRIDDGAGGDSAYIHKYGDEPDFEFIIGGRFLTKRDEQDIEPMVRIPFNYFERLDR